MRNRRTTREKSPWAVISILIAIALFGMFWLWQKQQIASSIPQPMMAQQQPVVRTAPKTTPTINDLEASAANIAIPSFEKVL